MSDLIDNEGVVAVSGPRTPATRCLEAHPNAERDPGHRNGRLRTAITAPVSAGADNYMFRVSMVDREQIAGLMAYVKNNPAVKTVGYLAETTGYGQGGLKDIEEIGDMHGLEPACLEKIAVSDTDNDFAAQQVQGRRRGHDRRVGPGHAARAAHGQHGEDRLLSLTLMSWAADNQSFYEAAGKTLAEHPIFMRTVTEERTPRQQQLYDRVAPEMASPSAFGFAAHSYDAVMLLALAIEQANSTEGAEVREALENLEAPYDGVMKTYSKPFSPEVDEALLSEDYRWTRWSDGKLLPYSDDVITSLTEADFKK